MKCILVIAVVAAAVVSSSLSQPCSSKMAIVHKCLSDNGLAMPDYAQYTQGANFDAEVIQKRCSQYPVYIKTFECVSSEFARCNTGEDLHLPTVDQATHVMGLLCNDSRIQFDCLSKFQQQRDEVESCFTSQYGKLDESALTPQQIRCESAKLATQCRMDVITTCDAHTGSVAATIAELAVTLICRHANSR